MPPIAKALFPNETSPLEKKKKNFTTIAPPSLLRFLLPPWSCFVRPPLNSSLLPPIFQFTVGVSVPVSMNKRGSVVFSSAFQFNYRLPSNLSQLEPTIMLAREARDLNLQDAYEAIENLLDRWVYDTIPVVVSKWNKAGRGWMERFCGRNETDARANSPGNRDRDGSARYRSSSRKNKRADESVNTGWKRTNKFVINRDTGIGRDRSIVSGELMKFHFLLEHHPPVIRHIRVYRR